MMRGSLTHMKKYPDVAHLPSECVSWKPTAFSHVLPPTSAQRKSVIEFVPLEKASGIWQRTTHLPCRGLHFLKARYIVVPAQIHSASACWDDTPEQCWCCATQSSLSHSVLTDVPSSVRKGRNTGGGAMRCDGATMRCGGEVRRDEPHCTSQTHFSATASSDCSNLGVCPKTSRPMDRLTHPKKLMGNVVATCVVFARVLMGTGPSRSEHYMHTHVENDVDQTFLLSYSSWHLERVAAHKCTGRRCAPQARACCEVDAKDLKVRPCATIGELACAPLDNDPTLHWMELVDVAEAKHWSEARCVPDHGRSASPSASRNHCAQRDPRYDAWWNPFLRGAVKRDRTAFKPFSAGVNPVPVGILTVALAHIHVGDIVRFTLVFVVKMRLLPLLCTSTSTCVRAFGLARYFLWCSSHCKLRST